MSTTGLPHPPCRRSTRRRHGCDDGGYDHLGPASERCYDHLTTPQPPGGIAPAAVTPIPAAALQRASVSSSVSADLYSAFTHGAGLQAGACVSPYARMLQRRPTARRSVTDAEYTAVTPDLPPPDYDEEPPLSDQTYATPRPPTGPNYHMPCKATSLAAASMPRPPSSTPGAPAATPGAPAAERSRRGSTTVDSDAIIAAMFKPVIYSGGFATSGA